MSARSCSALLLHLALTSEPPCVRQAAEGVRRVLAERGCGLEAMAEIELCAVEAMNNIVEHGYGSCAGKPFELTLWWNERELTLELRDEGEPIPEEALAMAALPEADFEERGQIPDRGWGLRILRALMDEVSYEARPGGNLLRLVRRQPLTGSR